MRDTKDFKFRAWDKKRKVMEQCVEISPFHIGDCDRHRWLHDEVVLMQYTGLQDDTEDQNELYEGDIAEIEYEGQKYICEIDFCAGGFMFVNDGLPDGYMFLYEFTDYDRDYGWVEGSRKLGNKFEHPHLLGGNQA